MTYRTLTVVALALIAGTALADGPRPGGMRGPDIDNLAIILELDEQQKLEFDRIMTAHHEAAMARREAHHAAAQRPDRETMEAEREQMRANLRTELESVLSAEQLEKFEAMRAMRDDRPPRHHKHGHRDFDRPDADAT